MDFIDEFSHNNFGKSYCIRKFQRSFGCQGCDTHVQTIKLVIKGVFELKPTL